MILVVTTIHQYSSIHHNYIYIPSPLYLLQLHRIVIVPYILLYYPSSTMKWCPSPLIRYYFYNYILLSSQRPFVSSYDYNYMHRSLCSLQLHRIVIVLYILYYYYQQHYEGQCLPPKCNNHNYDVITFHYYVQTIH